MITVITPTHDTRYLAEAADSLRAQDCQGEWEWLLVPNGAALSAFPSDEVTLALLQQSELPLRVARYFGPGGIGAIKRFACERARGDIVIELDHDDLLTSQALRRVSQYFAAHPDVGLVYSNFAEFRDGTWEPNTYDVACGWEYREGEYQGHRVLEARAFPPTAHSISSINFAPNHLRAWRASEYWRVGGHDPRLLVADDHDLVCRFYLQSKLAHIDELLYLYRLHGGNSYLLYNNDVQQAASEVRERYLHQLAARWAELHSLAKVDICCGAQPAEGYVGVDIRGGQLQANLDERWPFADNSVGIVRACDALEHFRDPIHTMQEIWRVLAPGGWLLSMTPSTDGRGAFQDPSHRAFFNEHSFWYWTRRNLQRFLPRDASPLSGDQAAHALPVRLPFPPANGTYSGITATLTAGENLIFGDVVYMKSDGKVWKAAASTSSTAIPAIGMATGSITAGTNGAILIWGFITGSGWNGSLTVGSPVYLGTTAGAFSKTQPTATDQIIQIIGIAMSAVCILIKPSNDWITHT